MAHGSPLREPNNNENEPEDGAQAVSRFHIACQLRTLTVPSMVTGERLCGLEAVSQTV